MQRCTWPQTELDIAYHDTEWVCRSTTIACCSSSSFGTFDNYVWQFVDGQPRNNAWRSLREIAQRTPQSDALSKDLQKRGFRFVGSTICYAFMEAVGMVNDHLTTCFRYKELLAGDK